MRDEAANNNSLMIEDIVYGIPLFYTGYLRVLLLIMCDVICSTISSCVQNLIFDGNEISRLM